MKMGRDREAGGFGKRQRGEVKKYPRGQIHAKYPQNFFILQDTRLYLATN